jgi:hypothetical protein
MFEDLELTELRAVLDPDEFQELFVEIARCPPIDKPRTEHVRDFLRHHQEKFRREPSDRVFNPKWPAAVDRAIAERYLAVLFQWDLVWGMERFPRTQALRAAGLFLAPFGPGSWFHPTIDLDGDNIARRDDPRQGCGASPRGFFGTTFEEGLFAFDPAGHVGALFVGEED